MQLDQLQFIKLLWLILTFPLLITAIAVAVVPDNGGEIVTVGGFRYPYPELLIVTPITFEVEVLDGFSEYIRMYEPIIILEIQNESIGIKIKSIMNITHYSFFNIDERKGIKLVQKLGIEKENKNFLLCPNSKLKKVNNFIFKN